MPLLNIVLSPTDPLCPTTSMTCSGSIIATVTGGTLPYSFFWRRNGVPFATTQNIFNLCEGTYELTVTDSSTGNNSVNVFHTFDGTNGASPSNNLIEVGGELWGMTSAGGANSTGVIFKIDFNGVYVKIKDFDAAGMNTNGSSPFGSLYLATDGLLYGMTFSGGSANNGVLFSLDPNILTYTVLKNFDDTTYGKSPTGSLLQDGNILYGVTGTGGTHSNSGTIFSYNILTSTFTKLYDLDSGSNEPSAPKGSFIKATTFLWATSDLGGANAVGTIFKFNTSGNVVTVVHSFNTSDGKNPQGDLLLASNGKMYGLTTQGGANGFGALFSVTTAGVFTKLFDFYNAVGSSPSGSLIEISGVLWGLCSGGGSAGHGTIFSYDIANTTLTKQYDFIAPYDEGETPFDSLFLASNGKLYGACDEGGSSEHGTLFVIENGTTAKSTTITAPDPIDPHADITNETCYSAGSITLTPTGGSSPYTYAWSNGLNTSTIDVSAGTYSVIITDDNGCTATFTYTVGGFIPITVLVESVLEKCFEGNIDLTAVASGGTLPYAYLWSTGATTATIQADAGATYTVTATDDNGCTGTTKVTVPTQLQSYICCLADKMYEYALKLKNGLKVCKCEKVKNLVLSVLIDVYENYTTAVRVSPAITDQEQLINDTSLVFGDSGGIRLVAQSFVPTFDNIVSIDIKPDSSGSYLHNVTLAIYDDNAGSPNASICSAVISTAIWNAHLSSVLNVVLPVTDLIIGNTYWIVLSSDVLVAFGRPSIKTQGTGSYGVVKTNSGASWNSGAGESFYFQEYGYESLVPDCLSDEQKQTIKGLLTEQCGCCSSCEDLPQTII